MAFTNAGEIRALESLLEGSTIALFTFPPSDSGTGGTEVTGGGYARESWTVNYTPGAPSVAVNGSAVQFNATGSWGIVSHAVVMDASSTPLVIMELVDPASPADPLPKSISSGDDLQFPAGEIVITLE